jgi:hypothetical protein
VPHLELGAGCEPLSRHGGRGLAEDAHRAARYARPQLPRLQARTRWCLRTARLAGR